MDDMILFLVVLLLAALAATCLLLAHRHEPRRPGPIGLIALIASTAAISLAWSGAGNTHQIAWLTVSLPLVMALMWSAGVLIRAPEVESQDAWPWVTTAILTALLAAADRVRFLDAQLLMLAGVALFWWRSTRAATTTQPRTQPILRFIASAAAVLFALAAGAALASMEWIGRVLPSIGAACLVSLITVGPTKSHGPHATHDPPQSLPTGRIGDPAVTLLLALTLGLGATAFAHIARQIRHELANTAGGLSSFDTVVVIADSLRTAPYMPGLRPLADAAWIAGAAAVAIVWMSALPPRIARIAHRVFAAGFSLASLFLLLEALFPWRPVP